MRCTQEEEVQQLQSTLASGDAVSGLVAVGMSAPYAALLLQSSDDTAVLTAAALLFAHLLHVPVDNAGRRALCQALHDADRHVLLCVTFSGVMDLGCNPYDQHNA